MSMLRLVPSPLYDCNCFFMILFRALLTIFLGWYLLHNNQHESLITNRYDTNLPLEDVPWDHRGDKGSKQTQPRLKYRRAYQAYEPYSCVSPLLNKVLARTHHPSLPLNQIHHEANVNKHRRQTPYTHTQTHTHTHTHIYRSNHTHRSNQRRIKHPKKPNKHTPVHYDQAF